MKFKFFAIAFCTSVFGFSQQPNDSLDAAKKERKLELQLDVVSRYLWRGQCWGGDYAAIQPALNYEILPNLRLGFWATTNFQKQYAYGDGSVYKGYQEIDFSVSYYIDEVFKIELADYYWPSVEKIAGQDNNYFNYGKDGSKSVDLTFTLDFSERENCKYPFSATLSTLISGNDFRYGSNPQNPKRNFTTYAELGYTFTLFKDLHIKQLRQIEVLPTIGAVLNNQAAYYNFADYDKVSVCNIGISVGKEFELGKTQILMPFYITYTHNAASKNTEVFGKNFLVAALSLKY